MPLALIGVGLACFSGWRLVSAALDPDRHGPRPRDWGRGPFTPCRES
nr:hypothetical protein [Chenggangzhangella methanolivorans]